MSKMAETNYSNVYEYDISQSKSFWNTVQQTLFLTFKRIFDIFCSLIGLIVLIPLTLVVKVIYLVNGDKHCVIFKQKRIGQYGKEFTFYKFRTMVPNADEVLKAIMENDPKRRREYIENKKMENDPRITKAGKFLRGTSLDELPQVINILTGDMSVIGNRPYMPREKKDMGDSFRTIVSTKPGLTGYWQVHGRSDVSFEKRLELESYYSDHYSFKLDCMIFFKTFKVVLFGRGAK